MERAYQVRLGSMLPIRLDANPEEGVTTLLLVCLPRKEVIAQMMKSLMVRR